MRITVLIFVLFLSIAFTSCKKADAPACDGCLTFYFENPQPVNDSELDRFPNKFRGLYRNTDSAFIRIEEDRILKENFWNFKVHKLKMDSLKSEFDVIDGKLIAKDTKEKYEMKRIGDSIELSQKYIDTLFRFSYNQKAKRINNELILSTRDSIFWKVQFLSVENNTIKFRNIYYPEDLKKLDSVTAIKGKIVDSISYVIKPTRSEFKKILKIKKLGYDNEYKKV